jgi:hypothetical protein
LQVPSLASLKSGYYLLDNNIPIIIKGNLNSDIVILCCTNTDEAYSETGGYSFYNSNQNASTTLSFHRPIQRQGLMDGFLKWIWTTNYNINMISDMDMDDYSEIEHAKLLIIIGHSEYWTRQARINFDRFVDSGNSALILSGNTMWWQVRYSDDKTQLTCHRGYDWNGGSFPCCYDDDDTCDPLLNTIHWNTPSLKYSILGSIGAYFLALI